MLAVTCIITRGYSVISLSLHPKVHTWSTISFPSTLHLHPVLDLLLANVPGRWRPDLHLGLQEALVNAVKHGNCLDPHKVVLVRFHCTPALCRWIISDQGQGFCPPPTDCQDHQDASMCHESECGRGLFILHHIFDEVCWNAGGTELTLHKWLIKPRSYFRLPTTQRFQTPAQYYS
ncbi:MAG: ATP-binding protein [Cyanobacteria bacterium P01_H01_bin.121]